MFITFEGIDGTGKSTQVRLLNNYLVDQGLQVVLSREPGGTPVGEKIREVILNDDMGARTEALLFAAQRAEAVEKIIEPALALGHIVISDRYYDSSIVYQGIGMNLGANDVLRLSTFATNNRRPDLTFLFDMPAEKAAQRMAGQKKDRIEMRGTGFQATLREAYLEASKIDPTRFHFVQAEADITTVHKQIVSTFNMVYQTGGNNA